MDYGTLVGTVECCNVLSSEPHETTTRQLARPLPVRRRGMYCADLVTTQGHHLPSAHCTSTRGYCSYTSFRIHSYGYCMYQSRSHALASLFTTRASSLGDFICVALLLDIRSLAIEAAASHRGFFAHAHRLEVCGGWIGLGWLDLSFLSPPPTASWIWS